MSRRRSVPARVHAPSRIDFDKPLAPQFAIEKTTVLKMKRMKAWQPGSRPMAFYEVSIARVHFIDRPER